MDHNNLVFEQFQDYIVKVSFQKSDHHLMDVLVLNDFILIKKDQPDFDDKEKWQKIYELD